MERDPDPRGDRGKRVNRTEQLRAEGRGQSHRSAHVSEGRRWENQTHARTPGPRGRRGLLYADSSFRDVKEHEN